MPLTHLRATRPTIYQAYFADEWILSSAWSQANAVCALDDSTQFDDVRYHQQWLDLKHALVEKMLPLTLLDASALMQRYLDTKAALITLRRNGNKYRDDLLTALQDGCRAVPGHADFCWPDDVVKLCFSARTYAGRRSNTALAGIVHDERYPLSSRTDALIQLLKGCETIDDLTTIELMETPLKEVYGLWLALNFDLVHRTIVAARPRKYLLSHLNATVATHIHYPKEVVASPVAILRAVFPRALPHYGTITALDLSLKDAYALVQQSQEVHPVVCLPSLL